MIRRFWLMAILLVGLGQPGATACKYSVRDVAFVDLGTAPYCLVILTDEQTPAELTERLHGTAAGVLVDANVRLQMVRADDHLDAELKSLVAAQGLTSLPAAMLVAPDGRALPVALPSDASQENLWAAFEKVVSSPARDKLLDEALKSHSVVLLVEGRDDQANRRAREIAAGAIDQARRGLADLPKPIEHPPRLLVVTAAEAQREAVLLWSLQIDRHDDSMAHVGVLYGRGRRLGPVMDVPGATRAELSRLLWYVGQDCECDLDRNWMQGVMVPHRWDMQMQARAVKRLGFDAGNPMVIAEISRILSRGPSASGPADDLLGLDDPLMGYRELVIADPADVESDAANSAANSAANGAANGADPAVAQDDAQDDAPSAGRPASASTATRPPAKPPELALVEPARAAATDAERPTATVELQGSSAGDRAEPTGIGSAVGMVLVALVIVAAVGGGLVWIRSAREV